VLETQDRQHEERYKNRWFGKYRAFVRDNNDPERLGRVRLEIPAVLGYGPENWSEWAWPCFPYGGNQDMGMFFVPESPRWLAKNGRADRAQAVLAKIGGQGYANAAMADISSTLAAEEIQHVRFRDLLEPRMRRVLVLGVGLAVFQQWCGINVIFNYAEEIFKAAGYDISSVLKNIAWTGSVNLLFTFVALGSVDRGGRRPLMLLGAGGLALIYVALGGCFAAGVKGLPMLLLVLAAIACYSMSLAPVTWVVISEIFPNRIRGAAISVAVMALWIACFLLTYTFPILNQNLGPAGTFWLYAAICVAGFVFIKLKLFGLQKLLQIL
jgi:sugar porter (SP) family MFS transporter